VVVEVHLLQLYLVLLGTTKNPHARATCGFSEHKQTSEQLLGHYEVAAPVLLPAGFVALHTEGLFLAVADGADAVGSDAQRHHVLFNGGGAAIAEREIVFGGSSFVAMAFDDDFDLRIAAEKVSALAQSSAGIGTDVRFVEIEISVLHFAQEHFFHRIHVCGGWRFGGRLRDGDANGGIRRSTRPTCGHGIGRGIGWRHFGGAFRGYCTDIGRDGQLRGIGG